jgi:hypothetical protein
MSSAWTSEPIRPGDFLWCTKLHEDELRFIKNETREKIGDRNLSGPTEEVRVYEIRGKLRPAMILHVRWNGTLAPKFRRDQIGST